jgi:hypothetical protein
MLGSIARRSVVLSSRRSATKTRELRNLRRAGRSSSSISARTPTRTVSVSHPTLGGLTERVERVVDTLDSILKAGPRHLTIRQWQAAQIFRSAYEVLEGAVGNTMDFDRIRGGGLPGSPPPPRRLFALLGLLRARSQRPRCGSAAKRGCEFPSSNVDYPCNGRKLPRLDRAVCGYFSLGGQPMGRALGFEHRTACSSREA